MSRALIPLLLAATTLQAQPSGRAADWPVYGGSEDHTHYTTLSQISPANVKQLKVAWTYDTKDSFTGSEMQANPIVIDGVIDSGFRGDLFARVYNPGLCSVHVQAGDRIVQAIAMPLLRMQFVQVDALETSERGENGFGSTGV